MKTEFQPQLLRWARERAGFNIPELGQKLGAAPEKVTAWEETGILTLSQAEKLAHVTHTPLGYLFLQEPPNEALPVSDFRTVGTQRIERPSPDLLELVEDCLRRQDWYRDYLIANAEDPLPFVASLEATARVSDAAERIRAVVHWDPALRAQARNWEEALTKQIAAVEQARIMVMRSGIVGNNTHRPLSVGEFRGFALSDSLAPLVFLNGKDSRAAQMFTLAHEIVHIWLGVSGVSNLRQTYAPNDTMERFCNAVAAELLVPLAELRTVWPQVEQKNAGVRLTRHFKVSSLVILRRLRDANLISEAEFNARYSDELVQFSNAAATSGGGDFYKTLRARLGSRFTSALVESTLEGRTLYRDAFQLLGVSNAETVRKLGEALGVAA